MEALVYLLIYTVEAYIFYQYCTGLFSMKFSRAKTIRCIILGHTVIYFISFFHNAYFNISSYILTLFLLFFLLFSLSLPHALFHSFILFLAMLLSEILVTSIMSRFLPDAWTKWSETYHLAILGTFSKLLFFLVTHFFVFMQRKNIKRYTTDFGTHILILISICTVSVAMLLFSLGVRLPFSTVLIRGIAIGSVLMFIILLLVYHLYSYNQKKNAEFTDLQLQLQKESDSAEYYRMLTTQDQKQKIIIHDIRNHLYTLAQLSKSNQHEKVSEYLDHLIQSDSLSPSVRICDNELLNAILCRYQLHCKEKCIDFHANIRNGCVDFLRDEELTALFCNLLDNAMEAMADMPDESAQSPSSRTFIEIRMQRHDAPPVTTLVIENRCRTVPKFDRHGNPLTTKSNRSQHGYGLQSVARIAKAYNGNVQTNYQKDNSTFHTIVNFQPPNT